MEKEKNLFKKATRANKKLRIALTGPSGSGKTYSALLLATGLSDKVALVDTESNSSTHYTDLFNYDYIDYNEHFESHIYRNYLDMIDMAEKNGYEVLVIDSFSHAWTGHKGILELNEAYANKEFRGNTWAAWSKTNVTAYYPLINKLLVESKMHIICTMRSKTEHAMDKDGAGKTVIRKIGTKTQQRDDVIYEFDTVLGLQHGEEGLVFPEKDRTRVVLSEGLTVDNKLVEKFKNYLKS